MTRPITPAEAEAAKQGGIPDVVIDVFNRLIAKHLVDGVAVVKQDEAVRAVVAALGETVSRHEVFERKWMDVEPLFRKAGWIVEYDKPDYHEDYGAFFTFTRKRGRKA